MANVEFHISKPEKAPTIPTCPNASKSTEGKSPEAQTVTVNSAAAANEVHVRDGLLLLFPLRLVVCHLRFLPVRRVGGGDGGCEESVLLLAGVVKCIVEEDEAKESVSIGNDLVLKRRLRRIEPVKQALRKLAFGKETTAL